MGSQVVIRRSKCCSELANEWGCSCLAACCSMHGCQCVPYLHACLFCKHGYDTCPRTTSAIIAALSRRGTGGATDSHIGDPRGRSWFFPERHTKEQIRTDGAGVRGSSGWLRLHVFGHIHYKGGLTMGEKPVFVNAAVCDEKYAPIQEPVVIHL